VLHYRAVTLLRGLVPSPQWKPGEEGEGCIDALPPSGLVNIDFHFCIASLEIFCDVGVFKVVHLVHHPHGTLNDGVGTEGTGSFA